VATENILQSLRDFESRNVTFIAKDGSWPIVWDRAKGVSVWDADGKKYLDLTAAFGVAAAGHANPKVVKAGQMQMARLLHAMGDVHPHARKAALAHELSRITFEQWIVPPKKHGPMPTGKTIFCNSGFEAVEAALKTAILATGKPGIIAFTGGYHGLGYGTLNVTHRDFFRQPFLPQLREFGSFAPFPNSQNDLPITESLIHHFLRRKKIGAILVEPVQARGGIIVPPPDFLPLLRNLCNEYGALLIVDEIYTGFGRTGKWFACEHSGVIPDLLCLGKALTGGFPLSACVGRADLMDAAWPASEGEAVHTSTFLGHPVGCAMALAQIKEIRQLNLCERSMELGNFLLEELQGIESSKLKNSARGLGLMAGLELTLPNGRPASAETFYVIKKMLQRGYILLPEGPHGNVISFTPPLTIAKTQLAETAGALREILADEIK
jgi:4-aminobutyrate aminotransferase-like enzyme